LALDIGARPAAFNGGRKGWAPFIVGGCRPPFMDKAKPWQGSPDSNAARGTENSGGGTCRGRGRRDGSTRGAATNQGLRGGPGEDGHDDVVLSSGVVAVERMSRRSGAAWRYAHTCVWCRAETHALERGLAHNCPVNMRLTDVKFRQK
jgi:hypothetical protein